MNKIICIDAGHGGKDSGAVNGKRFEKDDNLRLALAVGKLLSNQNLNVVYTRTEDKSVSLQERSSFAKKNKANCFLSLHRNSYITSTACGIENWIYQNANNETEQFATCIYEEVVKINAQAKRGIKRGNYYVLRETNMPACLLELGFLSNEKDNIVFDTFFKQYAIAIAKGVCKFLNIPYQESPNETAVFYRVQVGAFLKKENAQKLVDELNAKGYQAYIV